MTPSVFFYSASANGSSRENGAIQPPPGFLDPENGISSNTTTDTVRKLVSTFNSQIEETNRQAAAEAKMSTYSSLHRRFTRAAGTGRGKAVTRHSSMVCRPTSSTFQHLPRHRNINQVKDFFLHLTLFLV